MTDIELLSDYSRNRSQDAFTQLVERYVRLVHSACWRQLRDAQLAEDATQMVFVLLSRKGGSPRNGELAGWLLTTAHYTCANMRRSEQRRLRREKEAAVKPDSEAESQNADLIELLDEGMLQLGVADRDALALRFLQEQPMRTVGESLGVSEDAARKRIERGLEKLRRFFRDRGIQTDSAALAVVLADQSHAPAVAASLTHRIVQAASAQPIAPRRVLRPHLTAVASVIAATGLGVAGWGFFRGSPSQLAAEPIHNSAPAAPVARMDAAPPATAPAKEAVAPDCSTPDKTLASLGAAFQNADRAAVEACMLPNPTGRRDRIDAGLEVATAQRRMFLAAKKAYGPDAMKLMNGQMPVDTVLSAMVVLRRLRGDTAVINGNFAVITVQIPQALIDSLSGDPKKLMEDWNNKPLHFELHDGRWLLDARRSVRMEMNVQRKNGPSAPAPEGLLISITHGQAVVYERFADQIGAGHFATVSDAQRVMENRLGQVLSQYGVVGLWGYLGPADVALP